MKKVSMFISIFIVTIYLSSAIDIVLTSGTELENNNWNDLSSVLNKTDISGNNININGKFNVDGKICDINNNCLGECEDGKIWDITTSTCVLPATIPGTAPSGSTCKSILAQHSEFLNKDGYYFIKPTGLTQEVKVWCDMTTNGGGRTRWYDTNNDQAQTEDAKTCRNNGSYVDENFTCIKPDLFNSNNYYFVKDGTRVFKTKDYDLRDKDGYYNGPVQGRSFGGNTCREYASKSRPYNDGRFNGTGGYHQIEIDCFIK